VATFEHTTTTRFIHRWTIPAAEPWGAAAEEIAKAWGAAESKYREVFELPKDQPLSGNALSFHVTDDAVVIEFTSERSAA
jgi:hypothetical protein